MSLPQSHSLRSDRPPKVPIPRLARRAGEDAAYRAFRINNKSRVSRACLSCRARKVKCNGERPQCHNCVGSDKPCEYPQDRGDRLRTSLDRNREMAVLLNSLKSRVTEEDRQQIEKLLEGADIDLAQSSQEQTHSDIDIQHGETDVSAEVRSDGESDAVNEDLLRDEESRATGFVGQGSELQWLRRLQEDVKDRKGMLLQGDDLYGPPGDNRDAASRRMEASSRRRQQQNSSPARISTSTFYLDNEDIDIDYAVDPFELPQIDIAKRLVDSYMDTVQDLFPVLSRTIFTGQFQHYYASVSRGQPLAVPEKWLATLNLVFTIGAKYLHLTGGVSQVGEGDHLIYLSRAHVLGLMGPSLISNPDLTKIQNTALLAFYFMSVGRVNRAWVVIGIALRFSYALGLHLRNEDKTATAMKKETLLHTWWAVYSLEIVLSTIAGRPSFVVLDYCTVPLPLPVATEQLVDEALVSSLHVGYRLPAGQHSLSEAGSPTLSMATTPTSRRPSLEPPNTGSYFRSSVEIWLITDKALAGLYSAKTASASWKDVQQMISTLCERLRAWVASLPLAFNFRQPQTDSEFKTQRLILEMHYFSTKILITRPCLCRLDSRITNQSKTSDEFNKQTARACVETAKEMTDILPDPGEASSLYQTGPWWSLVHNIMQALTVLLLELSYGTVHFPQNGEAILPSIKKLLCWLRSMRENNRLAARAYTLVFDMLHKLASRNLADISDLLQEDVASPAVPKLPISEDRYRVSDSAASCLLTIPELNQQANLQNIPLQNAPMVQDSEVKLPAQLPGSLGNPFVTAHDQETLFPFEEDPLHLNVAVPDFLGARPWSPDWTWFTNQSPEE